MLADYLGLPNGEYGAVSGQPETKINALPFAAYGKIYNDYYRDQNLVQEVPDTVID